MGKPRLKSNHFYLFQIGLLYPFENISESRRGFLGPTTVSTEVAILADQIYWS